MKRGRNIIAYLPHDSNARNNDKVIKLRMKYGPAGYGVYFMLLERLREEANYTAALDYDVLAYDVRADAQMIESVINDFGLFDVDRSAGVFSSRGLLDRMSQKELISQLCADAGRKGMASRWGGQSDSRSNNCDEMVIRAEQAVGQAHNNGVITNDNNLITQVISPDNDLITADNSNTSNTSKQVSNISTTRTREAADAAERENISLIFFTKGFADVRFETERFYNHYESQGWLKSNGQPVKNRIALAGAWQPKNTTPKFEPWACEVMQAISKAMYVAAADRMSLMTISKITCDGDKMKFYCKRRFVDALEATVNAGKAGPVTAVIAKYARGGIEYKTNDVRTGV
ncbi:MAG: DUF4373 domain-containing protein [Bacteroidales bacterium]|nr:DUF4373 domain-containing protein [Bacteroidales bacterium]